MANYKNIVDVESVAEATESMNVLVEDAGSLKKVPAGGMLGGGNNNILFITELEDGTYTSNMTFEECVEAFNTGNFYGGFLCENRANTEGFNSYYTLDKTSVENYPDYIRAYFYSHSYGDRAIDFHSDNTITTVAMEE